MTWLRFHTRKTVFFMLSCGCLIICGVGCQDTSPPAQPAVVKKRIEQPKPTIAEKQEPPVSASSEKAPTPPESGKPVPAALPPISGAAKPEVSPTAMPPQPDAGSVPLPSGNEADKPAPAPSAAPPTAEAPSLKSTFYIDQPRYSFAGKVDPFAPIFPEGLASADQETPKRPLTPLEKIDLSQLKLVAILRAKSGNRAMVEDASGKGYILVPGIFVGMNSGKVTEILEDHVVIEEETTDLFGKPVSTKKELKIQKPSGEE